jgi:AcrR family transcriptional regulator
MTGDAPRRRATSQQTRARLLAAANNLFLADGYEATSVRAVAEAAEVTIGAFYGHFTSKRTVLFEVVLAMNAPSRGGKLPFATASERALVLTVASFANTDPKAIETLEAVLQVIASGKGGGVDPESAGGLLTDLLT